MDFINDSPFASNNFESLTWSESVLYDYEAEIDSESSLDNLLIFIFGLLAFASGGGATIADTEANSFLISLSAVCIIIDTSSCLCYTSSFRRVSKCYYWVLNAYSVYYN